MKTYTHIRGSIFWVVRGVFGLFQARVECDVCTSSKNLDVVGWLPISFLYFPGGGISCVSYDTCVYQFWFRLCVVPWGIPPLQGDWCLSCDHGLVYAT